MLRQALTSSERVVKGWIAVNSVNVKGLFHVKEASECAAHKGRPGPGR